MKAIILLALLTTLIIVLHGKRDQPIKIYIEDNYIINTTKRPFHYTHHKYNQSII